MRRGIPPSPRAGRTGARPPGGRTPPGPGRPPRSTEAPRRSPPPGPPRSARPLRPRPCGPASRGRGGRGRGGQDVLGAVAGPVVAARRAAHHVAEPEDQGGLPDLAFDVI